MTRVKRGWNGETEEVTGDKTVRDRRGGGWAAHGAGRRAGSRQDPGDGGTACGPPARVGPHGMVEEGREQLPPLHGKGWSSWGSGKDGTRWRDGKEARVPGAR